MRGAESTRNVERCFPSILINMNITLDAHRSKGSMFPFMNIRRLQQIHARSGHGVLPPVANHCRRTEKNQESLDLSAKPIGNAGKTE